jgi:hypothetical protein
LPRELPLFERYRALVLDQARLRLDRAQPFRPFLVLLGPRNDPILIDIEIDAELRIGPKYDVAKDEVVADIRTRAKKVDAMAVWVAVTGWLAPDDGKFRPGSYPKRRPIVMVYESRLDGDSVWLLPYRGGLRSSWAGPLDSGGGRFAGLLGGRRQLVDMDSYRCRSRTGGEEA